MATVFFYPHISTGSVGRRILLVVPVDTLYRTSIISCSTVLPLNPFVNLSLAPLFLFLTYGPDIGVWPYCWVSAEFLRAPIPRKGSGSTTTTSTVMVCDGIEPAVVYGNNWVLCPSLGWACFISFCIGLKKQY